MINFFNKIDYVIDLFFYIPIKIAPTYVGPLPSWVATGRLFHFSLTDKAGQEEDMGVSSFSLMFESILFYI